MLVADGCSGFGSDKDGKPIVPEDKLGILRYDESSTEDPTTNPNNFGNACADEPYDNLKPIVPWKIGKPSNERTSPSSVRLREYLADDVSDRGV